MIMDEIIRRYEELYSSMASSKDTKKMLAFGDAERWAFGKMHELSPKAAQCWLDKLEAMEWNNYLSKTEAEEIASHLVNQDGTKGAHWNIDEFKAVVESLNAQMSNPPFYNGYALWVTVNMLYSDHAKSAAAYVPAEDLPKYFYTMAVEQLKDPDRPEFVRAYFKV